MRQDYLKVLEKAEVTVNWRELYQPDAPRRLWERMRKYRNARGYSLERVRQIVDAQAQEPQAKTIPLSPELKRRLDKLGKVLGNKLGLI